MNFLDKILPFMQFGVFAKIGFLTIVFFFILFLIITLKQVYAMSAIISGGGNPFIVKLISIVLLVVAISLFLTALVIL